MDNNWIAQVAAKIVDDIFGDRPSSVRDMNINLVTKIVAAHAPLGLDALCARITELNAHTTTLEALLRKAKREHTLGAEEECPMAHPERSYNFGEPCDCGADAWNAQIDKALGGEKVSER